jgi:Rieske 2Fe-2S family protein
VRLTTKSATPDRALDPRLYTDPDVLERELGGLFQRTWQYAGHSADLPDAGSYLTAVCGDQPVLVLRGDDGGLRAFRNVCRHRGSQLLTGSGRCKRAIRCRYHGWTYDATDGRLLGVPEHRGFAELDKAMLGLYPVRIETLAGLVFVNLDPAATSLAEQTEGLAERLAPYDIANLERFKSGAGSDQPANWKIVVENYLEGYHVPIAHPGLMRILDYKAYTVQTHGGWAWFDAPFRDAAAGNRLERLYRRLARPMPGMTDEETGSWRYAFVYPNTAIDLYPDQVNIWQITPDGVDCARDVWACFRHPKSGPLTRIAQRANNKVNSVVLDEDIDLVAAVQSGVRSRGYEPGPLSAREAAVGWFAQRVRDDLVDPPANGAPPSDAESDRTKRSPAAREAADSDAERGWAKPSPVLAEAAD